MYELFWGLVTVAMVLFTYSYLYKYNILFEFVINTLVAISAAQVCYIGVKTLIYNYIPKYTEPAILLALILGIALYTRLIKGKEWISTYPIAILIGVGVGLAVRGAIVVQVIKQVTSTITPIKLGSPIDYLNFIIIAIGVISTLVHFIFTKEHKGALGEIGKAGRLFIMAGLGSTWGGLLVTQWTSASPTFDKIGEFPGFYLTIITGIIILADIIYKRRR